MVDLSSIMQNAQGGQAIENLSARFGLSPDQTQSAINALLPALEMGLQNKLESGGLGAILGHLGNPVHQEAYADPAAAGTPATAAHGGSVLGEIFGSPQTTTQVSQQAATESGVPASIIQAMLPVIVSMVMGGLMHGAQSGGLGGLLSSVLGSVMGGGAAQPTTAPDQGGLGGMLGGVLGGLFGGGAAPAPTAPATPAAGSSDALLNEISGMFKAGTPASPDHEAQLASILGR